LELLEGMKTRRSIRAFKPDPVPREVVAKIVETAGNCSSYLSTQPWEITVVSGNKKDEIVNKLYRLAEAHNPINPDIPLPTSWPPELKERSMEHGARRLNTLGIERDDREGREELRLQNFQFYGAPCAAFLLMDDSLGEWSLFDMGLFTQNFVLAAHGYGLGCCIQASVTEYAKEIKRYLGINEKMKMVVCISFGYPDPEGKLNLYRSLKKKPEDFFQWFE